MSRAEPSGRRLTFADAAIVKGMIARGDRHHDIAAWFGVNQGRIAEVNDGHLHPGAKQASTSLLPPRGPYSSGRAAHKAVAALEEAKRALEEAAENITKVLGEVRGSR